MINKIKENGVVYTPKYIVEMILDQAQYTKNKIIKKHVIDNSCGDGAFLVEIVKRYIESYFLLNKKENDTSDLIFQLETYIHGIEIDELEVTKCKKKLDNIALTYGLKNINWDVNQGDALKISKYFGKIDYVLGNPPYVRIHNLKENLANIKKMNFVNCGMTDLFIIFYELGLDMLNNNGKLVYITPSSIFNSLAGKKFRNYVINSKLLTSIIDLKHFQAFENFTTYTAIIMLEKQNKKDFINYYEFDSKNFKKIFIDILSYNDFFLDNKWYFGNLNQLKKMKNIINSTTKNLNIDVKNGFATLSDKKFIKNDFPFNSKFIYPIIKGSTEKWYKVFFPYDKTGNIVDFKLFEKPLQEYLLSNEIELKKRSIEKASKWYSFGRSQGIKDFWKEKICINNLIRDKQNIKLINIKPGEGIYSGLYIVGNITLSDIKKILISDEFINYVSILGKYKNGGYYTYSSNDLKKYICYKLFNNNQDN